jgi:lipopolysaccharide transport system ATP-binding protein
MAQGPSAEVIAKYNDWLSQQSVAKSQHQAQPNNEVISENLEQPEPSFTGSAGSVRFTNLKVRCDDISGTALNARSGESQLSVDFEFMADPQLPIPNLALVIYGADGRIVCSTGTWIDGLALKRSLDGNGRATLNFPKLPLLKGQYSLTAFLMCERAVHVYEAVEHFATVQVTQPHLEQGLFSIPHHWQTI